MNFIGMAVMISCLGILVYSNAFLCSFHFDDFSYIVNNLNIRDIHHLANIWNWWPCRFVTFFTFALNYHFCHFDVFGYHLFNLMVHLISAILVCFLVYLTLLTPAMKEEGISRNAIFISLFTGLVFVSHPIQTQAVTYIWQRTASMAAMFYLASLCFYVQSRLLQSSPIGHSIRLERSCYILSLITAVLAMFTKENTITLPLMIIFYELSFFNSKKYIDWKSIAPFLLITLTIPITWAFFDSERFQAYHSFVTNISSGQYLLTELRVIVTYIKLLFLPLNQNFDYDYTLSKSLFEVPVLFSLISLAFVLFLAKRTFIKYRLISFSIIWFFLTLLPESSFMPYEFVIWEHRLYLPLAGFSLFLVSALYYLVGRKNIGMMVVVLVLIIAFNSVLTYKRNKVWMDEVTFWGDVVVKSPHKPRAYNNLAIEFAGQGDFSKALSYFTKAIEIDPKNPEPYNNRGLVYVKQGDLNQAIDEFNKTIKINPEYVWAYYNRACVFYQLKEYNKAWADLGKTKELGYAINPDLLNSLVNKGMK